MPHATKTVGNLSCKPGGPRHGFFIISMHLFLEHVRGMWFDKQLRAQKKGAGVVWPDGADAAELFKVEFPAVYQLHGALEEQARLSCHPHSVLHLVMKDRPSLYVIIEQPSGTWVFKQRLGHNSWSPYVLLFLVLTYMGCFGHDMPKPTHLKSNLRPEP